jgi:tyrosine-protein kinase Etk/Wzc
LEKNIEDGLLIAPTSLGVNEANLALLVKDFTDLMLKKKEVGERSPLFAKYTRDLSNIKDQMFESLRNIRVGFNIEKADFDKRMAELQSFKYKSCR